MITLMNIELYVEQERSNTEEEMIEDSIILKDFYNFIVNYKLNNCEKINCKKDKKVYKLNNTNIDRNKIKASSETREKSFFPDSITDFFINCLENNTIGFSLIHADYGGYGNQVKIIDSESLEDEQTFNGDKAVTTQFDILFTIVTNDNFSRVYYQYFRVGNESPKYVIDDLISKFNETISKSKCRIKSRVIIPKDVYETFFGKGTYSEVYLYKDVKNKQSDEIDFNVFGLKKEIKKGKIQCKQVGVIAKGLAIAQDIRDKIVKSLSVGDHVKALSYIGYDLTDYDNALVKIKHQGRTKTFNFQKLNNENVSRELITRGLVNADGTINQDILLSEYLLELNDILNSII